MSYPGASYYPNDYPYGDDPESAIEESLATWNGYYDSLTDCCVECGGYHGEHAGDCLGVN